MARNGGMTWRLRDGDAAMVASPRWREEPPQSRRSRWRERLGWVAILSILLHGSIVALMFLAPAPPPLANSDESPPGEVALVFQGGSNAGPSAPHPSPEATVGPPSPELQPPAPAAGAIAPPDAVPGTPPPSPAEASPAPQSAESAPSIPSLAMAPPPPFVPPVATPPQQTAQIPLPPLSPPRPQPPRPALRPPPPRPRPLAPRPDAFPRPLNFAFNGSVLDGSGSIGHSAPHETVGPVRPGPSSRSAFNSDISGDVGPDYRALLSAWLERHKYYPPQAAEEGEDGTASVRVLVHKDGSVRRVELQTRSGSQWLDMGAQALFRGQRLPAFPNDTLGDEQEIEVTIHYILIRG